jgi:hypothetical protein
LKNKAESVKRLQESIDWFAVNANVRKTKLSPKQLEDGNREMASEIQMHVALITSLEGELKDWEARVVHLELQFAEARAIVEG